VSPVDSIDAAVSSVLAGMPEPVLLLDAGDNVGGGAAGDSVLLLDRLVARGIESILTIVVDSVAAGAAIAAGVGAVVDLRIGSRGSEADGRFRVVGTVRATHHGRYEETSSTTHAGFRAFDAGPTAAIDLGSGTTVVLTSTAVMPSTSEQVRVLGLDPADYRVIVAKGVQSPLTGYGTYAHSKIVVDTPGPTALDYRLHHYTRRPWPLIPFEDIDDRRVPQRVDLH
jgi:microcystin degradation protein MlrC